MNTGTGARHLSMSLPQLHNPPTRTLNAIGDVLVGIDGSQAATVALRWAAWFAAATQRQLHLAHAWQHGTRLEGPLASGSPDAAALEAEVESKLEALAGTELDEAGVVAGCRALRGVIAEALLKEACRLDASVLVVGARGAGGARRVLLGSVSRQLTECPARTVAVVPDRDLSLPATAWTMVVAIDGSAGASRALRWAADAAKRGGADIVAVHAFEPPLPDLSRTEAASAAEEVQQRLDEEWCAQLRARGVGYRSVLEIGDPRKLVPRVAASVQPACVVVGSRGLGPISQRLLGSVTHHLVRHLEWPTVVVPSPRDCVVWKI